MVERSIENSSKLPLMFEMRLPFVANVAALQMDGRMHSTCKMQCNHHPICDGPLAAAAAPPLARVAWGPCVYATDCFPGPCRPLTVFLHVHDSPRFTMSWLWGIESDGLTNAGDDLTCFLVACCRLHSLVTRVWQEPWSASEPRFECGLRLY